ncbi:MAG: MFS transporter, partial [Ilumatobacteraceae bacterium]|nr:MFS transporter [Ilumatobacteraceae bacterium]
WAVVHKDLGTGDWIANLGITLFALPLVILGTPGGRLAQTFGPFRLGVLGILGGATFMFLYGLMPTGGLIFAVAMVHAISDGLTVASSGVAVGMVVPEDRQAGAQGMLGAAQAITAGLMAIITAALYDQYGRTTAYTVAAIVMLVMVAAAAWLGREVWSLRRPIADSEPKT